MKTALKKLLAAAAVMSMTTVAHAQFRMIVPQEPGGGTSVWANILAKNLEKYLGEKIVIQHIPGAQDIPGFNEFHNKLRSDPKTIMVSHGGNALSYLINPVDYDYRLYTPIAAQNLTIVTAHRSNFDLRSADPIKFAAMAGSGPDMLAMTLLRCGNLSTIPDYIQCFEKNATYVKGMGVGDRRLAFIRGEINATRESTAAYLRHVQPMVDRGEARLWFSHGVLNLKTGKIDIDPNFPTAGSFDQVFRATHGTSPRGPLYDAYVLSKQYRDVLQKALWMDRDNPNADKVRRAVVEMLKDPEILKEFVRDSGNYEWMIGDEMIRAMDILQSLTTEQALKDLVIFTNEAFKQSAVFKPALISKN